jgi:hypothetical protein
MRTDTRSETLSWPPVANGEAVREEWVAAVEQVISDAEAWATEQHWFVHRDPKTITEDSLGSYEVPSLLIQAPAGRFVLEPRGRFITGATGAIELSVFPSYEWVLIVRNDTGWHFVIERPILDRPWSKEAFLDILSRLAKKA